MEKATYTIYKLRKVLRLYIYCLELYCQYVKRKNKSPVKALIVTKKLISINQRIQAIAKEINQTNKDAIK